MFKKAFAIAYKLFSKLKEPDNLGDMGLSGYCMVLEKIKQLDLVDQFDMAFYSATIKGLLTKLLYGTFLNGLITV